MKSDTLTVLFLAHACPKIYISPYGAPFSQAQNMILSFKNLRGSHNILGSQKYKISHSNYKLSCLPGEDIGYFKLFIVAILKIQDGRHRVVGKNGKIGF